MTRHPADMRRRLRAGSSETDHERFERERREEIDRRVAAGDDARREHVREIEARVRRERDERARFERERAAHEHARRDGQRDEIERQRLRESWRRP